MKKLLLTLCVILVSVSAFSLTSIRIKNIKGNPFCSGETLVVSYAIVGGLANVNNVYAVQLSDVNGNFTSPVVIGTLSATGQGEITCTLPTSNISGTGYRIRVVASSPYVESNISKNKMTIDPPLEGVFLSEATTTSIKLNWNSLGGDFSYKVRSRSVDGRGWGQPTHVGTVTSYVFTGLDANATYQFQVSASCFDYDAGWVNLLGTTLPAALRMTNGMSPDNESMFTIYPTVTSGAFSIKFNSETKAVAEVMTYNTLGQMIQKSTVKLDEGNSTEQFSLQGNAKGVYIVLVTINGKQFTNKIILE